MHTYRALYSKIFQSTIICERSCSWGNGFHTCTHACSCKLHVDHVINLMSITYAVNTGRKLHACWIISENNPLHHIHALRLHTTYMYTVFSPSKIQGMIWAGPTTALKLLKSNHSHIKEISILKVCWAKMLNVHWGEH